MIFKNNFMQIFDQNRTKASKIRQKKQTLKIVLKFIQFFTILAPKS